MVGEGLEYPPEKEAKKNDQSQIEESEGDDKNSADKVELQTENKKTEEEG